GRLVYGSSASGRAEVWMSDADGTNARQLTNERAPSMQPSVTPDGRYIVFQRFTQDGGNVWRMGIDGSDPKQLTRGALNLGPHADNAFVYYVSLTSGSPRPWKISIDGGEPVSLGDHHFRLIGLSPDGKRQLGVSWDEGARRSALAVLPVEGGTPQLLPDIPAINGSWAPDGRSITLFLPHEGGVQFLRFLPGEKAPQPLGKVVDRVFAYAWSPDGKQMALARGQASTDVVLITRTGSGRQ
ncbi:MAG: PD40 domain-containing protein, partial [Acidobacteria bacterium]|nr:PD40 domain-containing protein [Acidobacteriota bacterium]